MGPFSRDYGMYCYLGYCWAGMPRGTCQVALIVGLWDTWRGGEAWGKLSVELGSSQVHSCDEHDNVTATVIICIAYYMSERYQYIFCGNTWYSYWCMDFSVFHYTGKNHMQPSGKLILLWIVSWVEFMALWSQNVNLVGRGLRSKITNCLLYTTRFCNNSNSENKCKASC